MLSGKHAPAHPTQPTAAVQLEAADVGMGETSSGPVGVADGDGDDDGVGSTTQTPSMAARPATHDEHHPAEHAVHEAPHGLVPPAHDTANDWEIAQL